MERPIIRFELQNRVAGKIRMNFRGTSTEISIKLWFGKYCSCDKACQFSARYGTPWRNYLENQTVDGKFINKRVRLFMHQTPCLNRVEKKIFLGRHNRLANSCIITFKKMQEQPLEVLYKEAVLKTIFTIFERGWW